MSQVVLSPSVARTSVVPSDQRWGQTRTPESRAPSVPFEGMGRAGSAEPSTRTSTLPTPAYVNDPRSGAMTTAPITAPRVARSASCADRMTSSSDSPRHCSRVSIAAREASCAPRAEARPQPAARRDAVARGAFEVVDAGPTVKVEKLKTGFVAERLSPVQAAAPVRVARGVRPDLLHDDLNLREFVLHEAEPRGVTTHAAPRRAHLRLVLYLLRVEDPHKELRIADCGLRIERASAFFNPQSAIHNPNFFYSQRTTVTRVPRPTSDSISNSSTSRREPGSPLPSPRPVEKPSRMAAAMSGMPGPASSKMSRSPARPRASAVGCAIIRPRRAYLTTLRASSEATVASRVWSITGKPMAAATERTSPRATAMSCSHSRAIELLCKRCRLPVVQALFPVLADGELAAQELYPFVHVQDGVHAAKLKPKLYERDGDRGPHADDDRSRVHDARHRRDVRENAPDEGVNHLKERDVYEDSARARALKLRKYALLKVYDRLVVHVHLYRHDQDTPDLKDGNALLSVHVCRRDEG